MITTFSLAGAIYLVGVGIVLLLKPSYMFTPDGDWKEFGIGQREDRHTPFPFWIFCLVWALVSYMLVLLMEPYIFSPVITPITPLGPVTAAAISSLYNKPPRRNNKNIAPSDSDSDSAVELPKGYYVLNKKATRLSGVPKYVYLGPTEPSEE
jgi:hypothetical protein